ncbi:cell wall proline rich protein [Verticillium dahliae]
MHYHRRAESAPEMVPFEASRFGINRFGSSSTMADVFEEDEEEDDDDDSEDGKTTSSLPTSKDSLKDNRSDAAETCSDDETPPAIMIQKNPMMDALAVQDEEFGRTRHAASMKSERSMNSLHEQVIVEEPRNVDFRSAAVLQETSDSTGSATPSPRHALGHTDLAPVEVSPLHLATPSNIPISPYSMSHGSSFPSPRSPMSYDAQRISTAPSSVNEENTFQSLLLGEPGPELRCSVDIPPSLTSSTSTMTRDSTFVPMPQPRAQMPFRPDQRPVSVSSAAFGRRRSSLASLSRLISSSHGERSKLSEEVPVESEAAKKQKVSRAKRLSRMVQFWKAKDESET